MVDTVFQQDSRFCSPDDELLVEWAWRKVADELEVGQGWVGKGSEMGAESGAASAAEEYGADAESDVAMDEDRKDNGELVCYYHNHLYRKFTSLQVENVAEALNPLRIRLRPHESQRAQRSHSGLHLLV